MAVKQKKPPETSEICEHVWPFSASDALQGRVGQELTSRSGVDPVG